MHTAWPDRLDHVLGKERDVVKAVRPHVVETADALTLSTATVVVKARPLQRSGMRLDGVKPCRLLHSAHFPSAYRAPARMRGALWLRFWQCEAYADRSQSTPISASR